LIYLPFTCLCNFFWSITHLGSYCCWNFVCCTCDTFVSFFIVSLCWILASMSQESHLLDVGHSMSNNHLIENWYKVSAWLVT
jgi:hypothetical protein